MLGKLVRDRYQIVQVLSAEGLCHTYIAKDVHLHHSVTCIVKHFQAISDHPESLIALRGLFLREVEALKRLGDYDRVPQLLDYFEDDQQFYLVQEFVAGNPLSAELTANPSWSETQVIELLQEVLLILEFIHSHGLIHRDIQPSNIIRRQQDDRLVLVDFGSVKQAWTQVVTNQGTTSSNYFLSGPATIAIGTAGYMPTEQAQGRPRPNSDIYALGMIAIQALTGLTPSQLSEDPETGEIVWQHDRVNPALVDIINKMVCYHYRDRYQSATVALQALQLVKTPQKLNLGTTTAEKQKPSQKTATFPRNTLVVGVLIGFATAVALIAVSYYFTRSSQPTPEVQPSSLFPKNRRLNKIILDKALTGHADTVWSIAQQPNTQNILSSSADKTVKLWNISSGKVIQTFARHSSTVWAVAVSPDGKKFASASGDRTADVWDLATGKFLCTLAGHSGTVWSAAFSTDGEIATASDDTTIRLWSTVTGKAVRQLNGHSGAVRAIAFSPNGQHLISASSDKTIKIWDWRSGKVLKTLTGHRDRVLTLALSPDGQILASGSVDKTIKIWQLSTGILLHTLSGNSHWVNTVAISPDGRLLASGIGRTIEIWDLDSKQLIRTPFVNTTDITAVFFSADSKNLIASSRDTSIKIWQL